MNMAELEKSEEAKYQGPISIIQTSQLLVAMTSMWLFPLYSPPKLTSCSPDVLRGHNLTNFPVYEPSAARVAKIMEDAVEDPLSKHYDGTNENRAKGAAFYQFSEDEETRRRQMDGLLNLRDETEKSRETAGVTEGPQEEKESEGKVLNRASAKRKRDLEERRALLDAKRRKKVPTEENNRSEEKTGGTGSLDAMDFLAKMSRELGGGS